MERGCGLERTVVAMPNEVGTRTGPGSHTFHTRHRNTQKDIGEMFIHLSVFLFADIDISGGILLKLLIKLIPEFVIITL